MDPSIRLGYKSHAFKFGRRKPFANDIVVLRVNDDPRSAQYDGKWAEKYPFYLAQIDDEVDGDGEETFVMYNFERYLTQKDLGKPWFKPNVDGTPLSAHDKLMQALDWKWVEMVRVWSNSKTIALNNRHDVFCYVPPDEIAELEQIGGKKNRGRGKNKISKAQFYALRPREYKAQVKAVTQIAMGAATEPKTWTDQHQQVKQV
jgi:hypothetical protein